MTSSLTGEFLLGAFRKRAGAHGAAPGVTTSITSLIVLCTSGILCSGGDEGRPSAVDRWEEPARALLSFRMTRTAEKVGFVKLQSLASCTQTGTDTKSRRVKPCPGASSKQEGFGSYNS